MYVVSRLLLSLSRSFLTPRDSAMYHTRDSAMYHTCDSAMYDTRDSAMYHTRDSRTPYLSIGHMSIAIYDTIFENWAFEYCYL